MRNEDMRTERAWTLLGVGDKDIDSVKKAKDSSRFLVVLVSAIVGVAAFVTGHAASREVGPGYPYSAISAASLAGVGGRRAPWAIALLVAVVAVFFFDLGFIATHPIYGEGSYYGAYERKT